ncbi:hypothetical protein CerSpe_042110 [Prunus speciosa]
MEKKDDRFFKTLILSPFRYTKTRHIRIADILVDEEEGSETDGYDCVGDFNMDGIGDLPKDDRLMALQCSTPRRIISRWLSSLRRSKRRRSDVVRSQKIFKEVARRETGDESTHATCSTHGLKQSGQFVEDNGSFNLGVACGLIYLIVASKNELTKMVELRTQMELLLQNAKEGLQSKNAPFDAKPLELNEMNIASSTTDFHQASSSSSDSQFSLQSGVVRDVCSEYIRNEEGEGERDECVAGMDQLEAELEAELERLQLQLDSENDSSNSKYPQQRLKVKASRDCALVIDCDEAGPPDYAEMPCDYGVPALELERRLHQVLEARQEERIKELEVALEYAKRKLHEKEIEVSWWKETATATRVSHHVPDPSASIASQHDPESTFHSFR